MSPKQWWTAAIASLVVAGVIMAFSGHSNLLHIVSVGFVFLSLWLLKQRKVAARLKQSQAMRDILRNEP